eukprot:TRINITY_DN6952_c0_g2_i1.p1 TRINITY_DN6952_c0_g2~~TRINITY_DN6952_c0_g2_i1.p1  ORF type:complete len:237 (-),score=54.38 TRINITY_DN6952_c0_g2_i1:169-879(-)
MTIVEEALYTLSKLTAHPEIVKAKPLSFKSLLACLQYESRAIQEYSVIAVGNIVNADSGIANSLVDQGLVAILMKFLSEGKIMREVCWVLSNLALCGDKTLTEIIERNTFEAMVDLARQNNVSTVKEAVWVIMNSMLSSNKSQLLKLVEANLVEQLIETLHIKDVNVNYMVLDGISKALNKLKNESMSDVLNTVLERLKKGSASETIEQFAMHPNPKLSELALQILQNAATSVDSG